MEKSRDVTCLLDARNRVTLDIQGPPGMFERILSKIMYFCFRFRTTWSTG